MPVGPAMGALSCQTLAVAATRGLLAAWETLQGAVRPVLVRHEPSMAVGVFGFAVSERKMQCQRRARSARSSRVVQQGSGRDRGGPEPGRHSGMCRLER